eukprot:501363-Pyramimonas_sp.AAC.1
MHYCQLCSSPSARVLSRKPTAPAKMTQSWEPVNRQPGHRRDPRRALLTRRSAQTVRRKPARNSARKLRWQTRHDPLHVRKILVLKTTCQISHNLRNTDPRSSHCPPGPGGPTGSRRYWEPT